MIETNEMQDEELHLVAMAFKKKYASAYFLINKEFRPENSREFGVMIQELFEKEYENLRIEIQPLLEQWKAKIKSEMDTEPMDRYCYLRREA